MSECILWTKHKNSSDGYGRIMVNGKRTLAHRAVWEEMHGPVPTNRYVLHKCNNSMCVNINHLYLGTLSNNTLDQVKAGTHNMAGKTYCKNGHVFDSENTVIRGGLKKGARECRQCMRERDKTYRIKCAAKNLLNSNPLNSLNEDDLVTSICHPTPIQLILPFDPPLSSPHPTSVSHPETQTGSQKRGHNCANQTEAASLLRLEGELNRFLQDEESSRDDMVRQASFDLLRKVTLVLRESARFGK